MDPRKARAEVVLEDGLDPELDLPDAAGMMLEIDDDLIAAALASVERGGKKPPVDVAKLEERLRVQDERIARLTAELERARAEREELDAQTRAVVQQLRERTVETEQLRARGRREREESERQTEERLLRGLLDVYDNLDRAWFHAMSDPDHVLAGLQMIHDQFSIWLRRAGAERVPAADGPFDPAVHEAVMYRPSDSVAPGQVLEELSAGFKYRGRLLRPARVVVSSP